MGNRWERQDQRECSRGAGGEVAWEAQGHGFLTVAAPCVVEGAVLWQEWVLPAQGCTACLHAQPLWEDSKLIAPLLLEAPWTPVIREL